MIDPAKIAKRVARRIIVKSYRASGDLEKVVGQISSRSLGITDAPKEFFDKIADKVEDSLAKAGLELDLKDPEVYPYVRRATNEVADEMGMIK
jgi:hypothetical protein